MRTCLLASFAIFVFASLAVPECFSSPSDPNMQTVAEPLNAKVFWQNLSANLRRLPGMNRSQVQTMFADLEHRTSDDSDCFRESPHLVISCMYYKRTGKLRYIEFLSQ